ncbi:uncharacterized protein EI90DRAFT_1565754 [Cantharellus anzutake]|uniref:uncharacterized protein n=1 Tax=Cantharellus anzutake TaxID=1750568 RepID=UPI0019050DD2|nr:uncharacterized protein EI90DRAFT_1565754 [Cantharellus anzutake]KAF8328358.1 hypothetical protein EI90DRAFT_1565754 [Cantharellus anzutake]
MSKQLSSTDWLIMVSLRLFALLWFAVVLAVASPFPSPSAISHVSRNPLNSTDIQNCSQSLDISGTINLMAQPPAINAEAILIGSLILTALPGMDSASPPSYLIDVSNTTEPAHFLLHVEPRTVPNQPDLQVCSLHAELRNQTSTEPLSPFCAQFSLAVGTASPITIVPCTTVPSNTTSQLFSYDTVTGLLNPLWTSVRTRSNIAQTPKTNRRNTHQTNITPAVLTFIPTAPIFQK